MPKEPQRILAINPGSRYIGIAAFRGPELLDWGVKVVTEKTPKRKVRAGRAIVLDMICQYHPDAMAIKRLHPSRTSAGLTEMVSECKGLARRKRIKIRQYSIDDVKAVLCPKARTNKRNLAAILAAMYPALSHDLQQEMQNRNPYRIRMFEAVALGSVCYQQLENN